MKLHSTLLHGSLQVLRTGLYQQDDDLAGMPEVSSDDGQEPDWAPVADPDSPGSHRELGDVSGGRKLQTVKKRARGKRFYSWKFDNNDDVADG